MNSWKYPFAAILGLGVVTNVFAGNYDFEVGLSYGNASADTTNTVLLNGIPTPSLGVSTSESEAQTSALSATWYYSGISDDEGPRARADFLSRASSIAASYARGDESTSFGLVGGTNPPFSARSDGTSDAISINFRHVWRASGWYALAGFSRLNLETDSSSGVITIPPRSDTTAYSIGVGNYVGKTSTLDLRIVTAEIGSSNASAVALTFSHIGSLGANWSYGAEFAYGKSDTGGAGDSLALRGVLFPTSEVEFGVGFSRTKTSGGNDLETIEAFAGWFLRDNMEISARYQQEDPENRPGTDFDGDEVGIRLTMRF